MKKWYILKKYELKYYLKYDIALIIFSLIVVELLGIAMQWRDYQSVYSELAQYKDYEVYQATIDGELGESIEQKHEKNIQLMNAIREDQGLTNIGYGAKEIDGDKISIDGADLYCTALNYQFNKKNLIARTGFSNNEYELVAIKTSHKIGDEIDGVVNGQNQKFRIADIMKKPYVIEGLNMLTYFSNKFGEVYLLNPLKFDKDENYAPNTSEEYYIQTAKGKDQNLRFTMENNGEIMKDQSLYPKEYTMYKYADMLIGLVFILYLFFLFFIERVKFKKKSLLFWNLLSFNVIQREVIIFFDKMSLLLIPIIFCNINFSIWINGWTYIIVGIIACNLLVQLVGSVLYRTNEAVEQEKRYKYNVYIKSCKYIKMDVESFYILRMMAFLDESNTKKEIKSFLEEMNYLKYKYEPMRFFDKKIRIKMECYYLYRYEHIVISDEQLMRMTDDEETLLEIKNFKDRMEIYQ